MSWGRFKWPVIVIAIGLIGIAEEIKDRKEHFRAQAGLKTAVVAAGDEFNPNKRWAAFLLLGVGVVMFVLTARKRPDDDDD
jgi:hypothetical protein